MLHVRDWRKPSSNRRQTRPSSGKFMSNQLPSLGSQFTGPSACLKRHVIRRELNQSSTQGSLKFICMYEAVKSRQFFSFLFSFFFASDFVWPRWPKSVTAQTKTSRHKQKLSRHKRKLHGTNKNCHGTNENFTAQTKTVTAQTKTSRHKQKLSRHKRKLHGTNKNSHGTNENFTAQTKTVTAQTKTSRHKQKLWRRKLVSRRKWLCISLERLLSHSKYGGIDKILSWENRGTQPIVSVNYLFGRSLFPYDFLKRIFTSIFRDMGHLRPSVFGLIN